MKKFKSKETALNLYVEEVSMKWMDRPSVKEMNRGGVYEMDGQTKCQKIEMPLKWIKFNKICWTGTKMCYYILSISVTFTFCGTFYVYPFHRHVLFSFL